MKFEQSRGTTEKILWIIFRAGDEIKFSGFWIKALRTCLEAPGSPATALEAAVRLKAALGVLPLLAGHRGVSSVAV